MDASGWVKCANRVRSSILLGGSITQRRYVDPFFPFEPPAARGNQRSGGDPKHAERQR